MTLIETAIQKLQQANARPGDMQRTARQRLQPNLHAPQPSLAEPASHEPPKTYLPCTLDSVVMEKHCILPRLTDESALRAYKILRTRLLQTLTTENMRSLLVTSTDAQQGKSLTSVNLAMALAQDANTSVFLVDLDLRRPQVAASLGMQFQLGIGDYLVGNATLDQIIYESGIPRLAIIPNGLALEHSSELLTSERMTTLVRTLNSANPRRIVIYDMPPVLMADDVIAFAPSVDGVLFVVAELGTERAKLEKARDVLAEKSILGVVLNRSSEGNDAGYY